MLVDANCGHDEADIYCNWKKFLFQTFILIKCPLFCDFNLFYPACSVNAKGELYELFMCLYLRLKLSNSRENLQTFVVLSIDSIIIPIFTQNRNNVQFGFLLQLFVEMNLHQSLWKCNPMTNTLALSLCYFVCCAGHKKCKNVAMTLKQ